MPSSHPGAFGMDLKAAIKPDASAASQWLGICRGAPRARPLHAKPSYGLRPEKKSWIPTGSCWLRLASHKNTMF